MVWEQYKPQSLISLNAYSLGDDPMLGGWKAFLKLKYNFIVLSLHFSPDNPSHVPTLALFQIHDLYLFADIYIYRIVYIAAGAHSVPSANSF